MKATEMRSRAVSAPEQARTCAARDNIREEGLSYMSLGTGSRDR